MNKARIGSLLLILSLFAILAGCGLSKRPAPGGEPEVPPKADTTPPASTVTAAVFFADWQAQHVVPEQRQVPKAEGAALATQLVKELLAGPTDPHLMRPIPANVTLLEPVKVEGGIAYVNLSAEMLALRASAEVNMALRSLRLTLTEVPGIQKVQLLVNGSKDVDLGGMVLEPMDRGLYPDPVLVDPERTRYLQSRFQQGLDAWRADPAQVVQWEGRMFGFTAGELQGARISTEGAKAKAVVTRGGTSYTVELTRSEGSIWTIASITQG